MRVPTVEWTPGPWRLAADFAHSGIIESDSGEIAVVTGYDSTGHETEANARLLAAAPALMDFLIELFTVGKCTGRSGEVSEGAESVWVEIPRALFVKGQRLVRAQTKEG
jgi:hypothetical protein